jgi:hypothetical protein
MKHVTLSLAAGLALATAIAMPAVAQQPRSTPSGDVVAARFTAEGTGQVQAVDPASGMVRLQTVDGPCSGGHLRRIAPSATLHTRRI